jgi:hypothetical protein
MTKNDKLSEIYYLINNVDPNSKVQIYWFKLKDFIKRCIPYSIKEFYRKHIEIIWRPQHIRIRKAIPKHWMDLDWVLVNVNFEIIKSFYEDEFLSGWVDWEADKNHRKFGKWISKSYNYIVKERPELQKAVEDAYPETKGFTVKKMDKLTYNELYGEVDRLEKLIHDTDTKIITDLVKYRDFLWT